MGLPPSVGVDSSNPEESEWSGGMRSGQPASQPAMSEREGGRGGRGGRQPLPPTNGPRQGTSRPPRAWLGKQEKAMQLPRGPTPSLSDCGTAIALQQDLEFLLFPPSTHNGLKSDVIAAVVMQSRKLIE